MIDDKVMRGITSDIETENESWADMRKIMSLIRSIECKAKLIEQYTSEKAAMERELYALTKKAMDDKRQLRLF